MDLKKIGTYVVVALVIAGGGYAAGRYAAPDKIVYQEKVKVVETEKVVATVETDKILNALKQVSQQKDVHTTKTVVRAPDGTTTVKVETQDKSKTDTKVEVQDKEKKTEVVIKEVEKEVVKEVTKTVERERPSWAVSLLPGFDVAGALGAGSPYTILPSDNYLLRHVVVGASLERRLIGPLSTGVWANTAGAGGLVLRLEF